ncbi:MAG: hypothetical protein ACRC2B_24745, partial [Rubrivivax sp.]
PAWALFVDGQQVEHRIDPATGLISVVLPAGRHEVSLTWELTDIERYSLYLSLLAAAFMAGMMVTRTLRSRPSGAST